MSVRNALVVSSADDARPSKATKVQQLRRLADLMEVEARIESEWKAIIAEMTQVEENLKRLGLPSATKPPSTVRHERHISLPPNTRISPHSFQQRSPVDFTAKLEEADAALQKGRHDYLSLQKQLRDTQDALRDAREQITRLETARNDNTETLVLELQGQIATLQETIIAERKKFQTLQNTHTAHMEQCGQPQLEAKKDTVDHANTVNAMQTLRALKENLRVSSSRMSLRSRTSHLSLQSAATTSALPSSSPATISANNPHQTRSRHTLPATPLAPIPQERTRTMSNSSRRATPKKPLPKRSEYLTALPVARQTELGYLPSVHVDDDGTRKCMWTRTGLKDRLGGSHQGLIIRITASQTPLAKKHGVNLLLCPNLDQNPWCPSRPGEHGYMFVGLTSEKDTFREAERASLFVGDHEDSTSSSSKRLHAYMGEYLAVRVGALPVDEWKTLSLHTRQQYAQTTKKRLEGTAPVENYMAQYDRGELQVPCVRLQCVGFNYSLHNGLVGGDSSDTSLFTVKVHKRPRTESNVLESPHNPKSSRSS